VGFQVSAIVIERFGDGGLQRYKILYEILLITFPYVGADLAGLVRCAGSIALARARQDGCGVEGLLITLDDVEQALLEIKKK
jgi:hypothetical protein